MVIKMKLNNVKTVTKKQAKAYAVIALDILGSTPNDIDVKMLQKILIEKGAILD